MKSCIYLALFTNPRDADRFLLSHGKLRIFRVCGKPWTYSGTVRLDLPWDDSEDLVEKY